MEVSVRELKNHLSEYLRQLESEGEITVTLRGRAIARLSAVKSAKTPEELEAEAIARLDAMPWIIKGAEGKLQGAANPIPWPPGEKSLTELVMEDRE